jgi:hypothetical protein
VKDPGAAACAAQHDEWQMVREGKQGCLMVWLDWAGHSPESVHNLSIRHVFDTRTHGVKLHTTIPWLAYCWQWCAIHNCCSCPSPTEPVVVVYTRHTECKQLLMAELLPYLHGLSPPPAPAPALSNAT